MKDNTLREIEDILNRTIIKAGKGANGSGGEMVVLYDDSEIDGIAEYRHEPLLDQLESLLAEEVRKAHLQEIDLLKEALTFGKKIEKDSWYNFDMNGYFNGRIKQLEKGK